MPFRHTKRLTVAYSCWENARSKPPLWKIRPWMAVSARNAPPSFACLRERRLGAAVVENQAMDGRSGVDGRQTTKFAHNDDEAAIRDDRTKMESACKPGPVRLAA